MTTRQLRTFKHWTPAEDAKLRSDWGLFTLAGVARRLGRTKTATFLRAKDLHIAIGCPEGFEYLTAAARRTGFAVATLRRMLDGAGVKIMRAYSRPGRKKKYPRHFVDPVDVDDVVRAWLDTETVGDAIRRFRMRRQKIVSLLEAGGIARPVRKKHWRLPTAVIDRALAGERRAA